MSRVTVTLLHGYKVGDDVLKDAVIRPYTTADLLDAEEESEKLIAAPMPGGGIEHKLVLSPALYGMNIFRRQVVSIGDVDGPFSINELKKKLHRDDFALLQQKVDELDQASSAKSASKAVTQRGRSGEVNTST